MLIKVGYEIGFNFPAPLPMLLMLRLHPSRDDSVREMEKFEMSPKRKVEEFTDSFGNRCGRVFAPAGRVTFRSDTVVEDSGEPDPQAPDALQIAVEELPEETLQFLLGSRYCEVDSALNDFAWNRFSSTAPGWPRVQAICDFVHGHIRFDYQKARRDRTARDVFREGVGVCRDFMHLAITFCRCMNIPARYATGYLGDIGVPPAPFPMDFSAWFEVFLGGKWYTFDARHNEPRVGRVLMARGRDAADVALTTTFGQNHLAEFKVWTDEVKEKPRRKAPARQAASSPRRR
ncbi:MAG TPA: transglutaminase family protein [Chthoniobacter sp.]|jgi:transglutaminase-like putative cysteine protease